MSTPAPAVDFLTEFDEAPSIAASSAAQTNDALHQEAVQPTAHDAGSLIRSLLPSRPGSVALHKLAYGWYRCSIIQTGTPDFEDTCAAFPLGPVFLGLLNHPDRVGDPTAFSVEAVARCHRVLSKLGAMSGRALAARSHKSYYEWRIMREGMRPNQVKQNGQYVEIPVSMIHSLPHVQRAGANVGYSLL
jgi:uncharacterized phage-associated protein